MENVEQLWSPISMQTERETCVTKAQALECLSAFIGDGSSSFRDHNTTAQLIRLQVALREDLVRKQTGTAIVVEEPQPASAAAASPIKDAASTKKRKREKKKEQADATLNGADAGGKALADAILDADATAADLSLAEPATKKKKKSKKAKDDQKAA